MINTPYVKQYDEQGLLINPIVETLKTDFNNRKSRREIKQKDRFRGNHKGHSLSIYKSFKYHRIIQMEFKKDGTQKQIKHYSLSK